MDRPTVIAVAPDHTRGARDHWGVPRAYLEAVGRAGATCSLVDPTSGQGGAQRSLEAADGLLLLGGLDIAPARYGAAPHPETNRPDPERDESDLAAAAAALAAGLPVLAVCRGFQVLAVAAGAALEQHLPDRGGDVAHGPGRVDVADPLHPVDVAPGSRLALATGATRLPAVASQHHQGIFQAPAGWRATAWAADGVVEAMEPADPAGPWALAVQWHPERTADDAGGDALFRALVAAAAGRAPARGA